MRILVSSINACHLSWSRSFCGSHQHLTVLHSKVCCDWLLPTLTSRGLFLVSCVSEEKTYLQNTTDGLDFGSQCGNIINTIFARAIFASFDVLGSEQWLEWSIDNIESLVGLNWTSLDKRMLAKNRVYRSQQLQLAQYGCMTDGCDFDRDAWPGSD